MPAPLLLLGSAADLPADLPGPPSPAAPLRLTAMARPPTWVRRLTHGSAPHACAEGEELGLMDLALAARASPLFTTRAPVDRYFAALEARWETLAVAGVLAPGVWAWTWHDGTARGPIRPGSVLVCTCRTGQECHLGHLAPFLMRAGWDVRRLRR